MDSLEDVRDKSFVENCRQKPMSAQIENCEFSKVYDFENDTDEINKYFDQNIRGEYLTPNVLQTFDIKNIYDRMILNRILIFQAMMIGIIIVQQPTGNYEGQKTFNKACQIFRINCITASYKSGCPFYMRYQRYDKLDMKSPFYLLDWNITHNHLLDTRIPMPSWGKWGNNYIQVKKNRAIIKAKYIKENDLFQNY